MRFTDLKWFARCILIGVFALAGCAGAGSTVGGGASGLPTALARPGGASLVYIGGVGRAKGPWYEAALRSPRIRFRNAGKSTGGIYVATAFSYSLYEYGAPYAKNRKPRCAISGIVGPNAIGVDRSGTLWVPQQIDDSGDNEITSYAPGCGTPGVTLTDPNGASAGIAFDSKHTSYVLDVLTYASGFTTGGLSVFPKGQTSPSRVLTDGIDGEGFAVGVDSKDNVYVLYMNASNTGTVVEFKKGKNPGITLGVATDQRPGGTLVFDKNDNMVVDENNVVATALVFAPPYNGAPASSPLMGGSWQCSFDKPMAHFACADYGNNSVDIFSYPALSYLYSLDNGLPPSDFVIGTAYDPAARN